MFDLDSPTRYDTKELWCEYLFQEEEAHHLYPSIYYRRCPEHPSPCSPFGDKAASCKESALRITEIAIAVI
jgi:hypothetical protein